MTRGLRVLTHRAAADQDLDDEVQHYLEQSTEALIAQGMSPAEARRAARHALPGPIATRQQVRDAGWEQVVSTAIADGRLAGRMLLKHPGFTAVVVVVIALGSGAVTTIYSAMNATVLRPIPGVADPGGLIAMQPARTNGEVLQQVSYSRYADIRDGSQTLHGVAAWGRVALTVATADTGTAVLGNMVSAAYFDVLGVQPALGRFFTTREEQTPGAAAVIVVSHPFWMSQLGGDAAALGRTLTVNGQPYTLIGVAPRPFHGVYTGIRVDAWVPLMMQPHLRPRSNLTDASWLWMFGRVREGLTPDAAEAELTALTTARAREQDQADSPRAITAMRVSPHSGLPGGEGRIVFTFMALMLAAAGLVLAIAGVNVATMLSARYVARQREMAVRAALGAGRLRLLRHLLTEVLMLFLLGAAGGFLVAIAATTALERIPLPENVPVSLELSPDMRVLGFALALSLLSGLVFGLAPALRTARKDIVSPLRDDSARGGLGRSLLNRGLVVGQLALSLVLLVAAGLFLRALDQGQRVDPGFTLRGVMTTTLEPESWGYDEPQARAFQRHLRERVEAMGGVTSVSFTGRVPLMMGRSPDDIVVEGTGEMPIDYACVDVNYFDVLQIPVLQGRAFVDGDDVGAERVAVVNETLARRVWPDGGAIGRTFRFRDEVTTVVGVVGDAKYASLDEQTPSFVYVPLAQIWQPTQTLVARTVVDPGALTREVQDAVWSIDPQVPRPRVSTLERATSIVLLPQRAAAIVTGVLGGAGLLLAAVGLYGLMTFAASRRTREIGIRVALGATNGSVLRMMLADGLRLAAGGIAVGMVLATLAARVLSPYLFDISPLDPVAFLAMSCVFVLVALVASYLPARRAARADPLDALRLD